MQLIAKQQRPYEMLLSWVTTRGVISMNLVDLDRDNYVSVEVDLHSGVF